MVQAYKQIKFRKIAQHKIEVLSQYTFLNIFSILKAINERRFGISRVIINEYASSTCMRNR